MKDKDLKNNSKYNSTKTSNGISLIIVLFILFLSAAAGFKTAKAGNAEAVNSQIKYQLTIIELEKEEQQKLGIYSALISSLAGGENSFLSSEELIGISASDPLRFIELNLLESQEKLQKTVEPVMTVSYGEKGSILISEEYYNLEEEVEEDPSTSLEIILQPSQINIGEDLIKSKIEIRVNDLREMSSTIWLREEENKAVGILNLSRNSAEKKLSSKEKESKKRSFAVFVEAERIFKLDEKNSSLSEKESSAAGQNLNAASLNGFEELIFKDDEENTDIWNNRVEILYSADTGPELEFFYEHIESRISAEIEYSDDYWSTAAAFPISYPLKTALGLAEKEGYNQQLFISFSDKVKLSTKVSAAVFYSPVIYDYKDRDFKNAQGKLNLHYQLPKMLFELGYVNRFNTEGVYFKTAYQIRDSLYLSAEIFNKNSDKREYLFGFRLNI